jgi:hypothetical protein
MLIYHQGDGKCKICNKVGNLKQYLDCCMDRGNRMTERHNNIVRILTRLIQIHTGRDIIISKTGNHVSRN